MNAVILTSVLSAANSGMYASTRMLYSLSQGYAQKPGRVNRRGFQCWLWRDDGHWSVNFLIKPIWGTNLHFPSLSKWFDRVYCLVGCHFRTFPSTFVKQGHNCELRYHAKWFPFGRGLHSCCAWSLLSDRSAFLCTLDWQAIGSLIWVSIVHILYAYYKIRYRTKVIPLDKLIWQNTPWWLVKGVKRRLMLLPFGTRFQHNIRKAVQNNISERLLTVLDVLYFYYQLLVNYYKFVKMIENFSNIWLCSVLT